MKINQVLNIKNFILAPLLFAQIAVCAAQTQVDFGDQKPVEMMIPLNTTDSGFAVVRILDEKLPTLILLPGIFRGFLKEEEFLQILNRRKLNWVAWHTSRHPESIISGNQNPWLKQISSQDLAQELVQLKRSLKIKRPLLVSLSYSSSFIPFVDPQAFPVVIETAPMGSALENTPPSPYYKSWRQWVGLFPIWGDFLIQSQEYWAYRGYWAQQTTSLFPNYPRYIPFQKPIAEGLAQIAYAARNFDLREQNFALGPKRFWILGQNENTTRKSIQLEAVKKYEKQTGHVGSSIILEKVGHVIPNENPEAFVKLLSELVQTVTK
jgi:pimeloyl-ACP methyl ester carboxylesterase